MICIWYNNKSEPQAKFIENKGMEMQQIVKLLRVNMVSFLKSFLVYSM